MTRLIVSQINSGVRTFILLREALDIVLNMAFRDWKEYHCYRFHALTLVLNNTQHTYNLPNFPTECCCLTTYAS